MGGLDFTGSQDVRITRGIEVFPSSFVLRLTDRLPDLDKAFAIDPGARCRLKLGTGVVITGYVDDYRAFVTAQGHEVTVVGRSAIEDLVDWAAGVSSGHERDGFMTFAAASLLQLAHLCKPFGISVTESDGEGAPIVSTANGIPRFTIPLNSTVFKQLEVRARWLQMLVLDGTDGNLVLAKAGTKKAASGVEPPGNVLDARVSFTKQDRYNLIEALAKWQKARDFGRSQAVITTVATWRDDGGTLWTPNTLAPVNMPILKLADLEWLITEITYVRGLDTGTRTQVRLMPREAFVPETRLAVCSRKPNTRNGYSATSRIVPHVIKPQVSGCPPGSAGRSARPGRPAIQLRPRSPGSSSTRSASSVPTPGSHKRESDAWNYAGRRSLLTGRARLSVLSESASFHVRFALEPSVYYFVVKMARPERLELPTPRFVVMR